MARILATPEVRPQSRFGQFISTIEAGGEAALAEIEALMQRNVKAEAPRVTGKLRANTRASRRGNTVVGYTITAAVPYAMGVHDGNPAHVIRRRRGRGPLANSFASNTPNDPGFFAMSGEVQHPGNEPYPYLRFAYERTWPKAMDIVDANIN